MVIWYLLDVDMRHTLCIFIMYLLDLSYSFVLVAHFHPSVKIYRIARYAWAILAMRLHYYSHRSDWTNSVKVYIYSWCQWPLKSLWGPEVLRSGGVIVLHSGCTARHMVVLCYFLPNSEAIQTLLKMALEEQEGAYGKKSINRDNLQSFI